MEEKDRNGKNGGNWIIGNLVKAALFFAILIFIAVTFLNIFTHHGQTIEVPDLTSMSVNEARDLAASKSLRIEVTDSIYVRKMARGAVYSQNPKAGSLVKKGRRILLTTNAVNAKKVSMPNLVGCSMRQAKAELNSRGLALGKLIYVSDMATNNVLRQVYRNSQIKPGRQIEAGSEIDLVVGLNSEDMQTYIPNVKGMKYLRAVDAVHDNSLNIKKLEFDASVKTYSDSLNAVVYRQSPIPSGNPLTMGSEVSLYLSLDKKDTSKEQ